MTGLPTVTVTLDDGSDTWSTDVSDRVSLSAGVSVSGYGRGDEFDQATASTLTLTLDNTDGTLTTGADALTVNQPVRLTLTKGSTTCNRFTGRIISGDLGWLGGPALVSQVVVTAVDRLADAAGRKLRSMLEEEILQRSPTAYYTLGEASGSTSAGDTSGNQASVLVQAGTGTKVVFGNGTGPVDGMTAATFAGGKYLQGVNDGVQLMDTSLGLLAIFNTSQTDGWIASRRHYYLSIGLGVLQAVAGSTVLNCPTSVSDGLTHTAAVFGDGTTAYFVVDGVLVDSQPIVANNGPFEIPMEIGGTAGGAIPFTGTISHVATFGALTVADVQAITDVATGASETTAERFARLCGYGDLDNATTTGMSGQTVGIQATSGATLLDALNAVAEAEGGLVYADGDGTIILQGRGFRAAKTTADVTLPAKTLDTETDVILDNQQQVTLVTVSTSGGATQVVGTSTTGVDDKSLDLIDDNDADALRAAQWIVAKHSETGPRLGSGTLDLLGASTSAAVAVLAADIGDRLAFTNMPTQVWDGFGDVTIEGWTETVQLDENGGAWTLAANLLPFTLFDALVLDDPVYGALDSYPIMN
jgi:hypothetical protein